MCSENVIVMQSASAPSGGRWKHKNEPLKTRVDGGRWIWNYNQIVLFVLCGWHKPFNASSQRRLSAFVVFTDTVVPNLLLYNYILLFIYFIIMEYCVLDYSWSLIINSLKWWVNDYFFLASNQFSSATLTPDLSTKQFSAHRAMKRFIIL